MIQVYEYMNLSGADPGILVSGGVEFLFKGMGTWGRLKAPIGFRATPWWAQGAKPPEAPAF